MSEYRADEPLCLLLIAYVAPLDDVDALMKAHVAWLDEGFAAGVFVVAGRQDPRVGGVVLARGKRAEAEALAASDPFVTGGVAETRVVAFNASFADPAFKALLG